VSDETTIKQEHIVIPILLGLALGITYMFLMLWKPFFAPIAWAAVFAIVFAPLQAKLQEHITRPWLSAVVMTILVIIIIVLPMIFLSLSLVTEVVQTYELVQNWINSGKYQDWFHVLQKPFFVKLKDEISNIVNLQSIDLMSIVSSAMQRLSSFAVSQVTGIVQNFSKTLFSFILMLFTLFYFFKDGTKIGEFIIDLIPLSSERRKEIVSQFSEVITATVLGDIVVAVLQGSLGGLAFWILGLPSPIFWGSLMTFLSILPVIGAPIVYIPAGVILLFQQEYTRGIILLIWGSVVVSQIDNFLRPILISGKTKLHTLILFFSILGGIYVFGFLGIIMGPVIAALFLTMIKIYKEELTGRNLALADVETLPESETTTDGDGTE